MPLPLTEVPPRSLEGGAEGLEVALAVSVLLDVDAFRRADDAARIAVCMEQMRSIFKIREAHHIHRAQSTAHSKPEQSDPEQKRDCDPLTCSTVTLT